MARTFFHKFKYLTAIARAPLLRSLLAVEFFIGWEGAAQLEPIAFSPLMRHQFWSVPNVIKI